MIGGVHRAPVMIRKTFHVESNEENLQQGVQTVIKYILPCMVGIVLEACVQNPVFDSCQFLFGPHISYIMSSSFSR